jgi:hypothetical protein
MPKRTDDRVTYESRLATIARDLMRDGQDPRVETDYNGCSVLSATHRDDRAGRFNIYIAPGGAWTHDANRASLIAERFPEEN